MLSFEINKKVVGKKLDGEWIFLNLENGVYYGLNETGSTVWEELKNTRDLARTLDRLEEIYGVDRSRLQKDIGKFLKDLKKEKLLECRDPLP